MKFLELFRIAAVHMADHMNPVRAAPVLDFAL